MPPTERWPLSCTSPRACAPSRKAASSDSSFRRKGTFIRLRQARSTGQRYSDEASRQSYSSAAFSALRRAIAARPPWAFSHWNTSPAM